MTDRNDEPEPGSDELMDREAMAEEGRRVDAELDAARAEDELTAEQPAEGPG